MLLELTTCQINPSKVIAIEKNDVFKSDLPGYFVYTDSFRFFISPTDYEVLMSAIKGG